MKSHVFGFALLSVTVVFASAPAQAQNGSLTRSFVSSTGSDSNPCTVTQPCQTFAQAYTAIGANGIIAALDPGKYGPLTITTGVTINGNGWSAITAPASGVGITISSGSGNVTLIGLEIDGAQAGYNGIVDYSSGSLTVSNCTLQNFKYDGDFLTGNGILMQPGSGTLDFTISNTTASNNGHAGISYFSGSGLNNANGVIDHVIANANNIFGVGIDTSNATGGTTVVTVSNSTASDNTSDGFYASSGGNAATLLVSYDNVSASGNQYGILVGDSTEVLLGRSVITGNNTGVYNGTTPSNTFYTLKNNTINLNGSGGDIPTALNTTFSQQ
jgi:hypothetical protein